MAAAGIKQIRRKIRAVANIRKITRAMQMVSAAKLRKVQDRLLSIRPYARKMTEMLQGLQSSLGSVNTPLFQVRDPIRSIAYVVITGDKGLCGAYNANLLRLAEREIKGSAAKSSLVTIGRKANDYFRKTSTPILDSLQGLPTEPTFPQIRQVTRLLVKKFIDGEIDEVKLVYTEFVNAVTFRPRVKRFIPIAPETTAVLPGKSGAAATTVKAPVSAVPYIFEPAPDKILELLLPKYVDIAFYATLLESLSSEHAARMNSMRNATDNAKELGDQLTLEYNKARQAAITRELLDIVGGAEALKG